MLFLIPPLCFSLCVSLDSLSLQLPVFCPSPHFSGARPPIIAFLSTPVHFFFPGTKMRSCAACPKINRPYSPLRRAAEAASSLYLAVQYVQGRAVEMGETQGCYLGCLLHYWGAHLSHQLQEDEGWNSLISCYRLKSGGKQSWPQPKSSCCQAEADVSLCRGVQGFVRWSVILMEVFNHLVNTFERRLCHRSSFYCLCLSSFSILAMKGEKSQTLLIQRVFWPS